MDTKIAHTGWAIKDRLLQEHEYEQAEADDDSDRLAGYGAALFGESGTDGDDSTDGENFDHGVVGVSDSGSNIRINSRSCSAARCFSTGDVPSDRMVSTRARAVVLFIVVGF